jgi:phage-related protein
MSSVLGVLRVALTGDVNSYISAMHSTIGPSNSVIGKMDEVGKGASGLVSTLKNAFSVTLGNLMTAGIGAFAGSLDKLKEGMIDGNAEFERYEVQFGVLLKSSSAAKQRLEELAQFGASTPFELPEVVKADKILQGFGLHSEEAAKKFGFAGTDIRTIAGDVAAGTGISFEEASLYIGKFASGATGEVISRFMELGITTREELAGLGLEFSKSGELLSPLPESMNTVLTLMKGKYGGMMDAQSKTFEGMMSNLNDWVAGTLRTIGQPIFEVVKDKLGGVLTFLGSPEVKTGISTFANTLSTGIGTAISTITDLAGDFMDGFGEGGLAGGLSALGARIAEMFGFSAESAYAFSDGIFNAITTAQTTLTSMVTWVQANWPLVQAAFAVVVDWVIANWPAISATIGAALQGAYTYANTYIIPMATFLLQVLGSIVTWVQLNWPLIQSTVTTVFNAIKLVVDTVMPYLVQFMDAQFTSIKAGISLAVNLILGILKAGMQVLNGDWKGAWETVKTTFHTAWANIKEFMGGLPKWFADMGSNLIKGLWEGISSMGEWFRGKFGAWIKATLPEWAQKLLGISSPSLVAAQKIGVPFVQGIAEGLKMGQPFLDQAMSSLMQHMTTRMPIAAAVGTSAAPTPSGNFIDPSRAYGGGGMSVSINHYGSIRNAADLDELAYKVGERLMR